MNKQLKLISLAIFLGTFPLTFVNTTPAEEEESEQEQETKQTFAQRIQEINMGSFMWEDTGWEANTMREYLEQYTHHRLNPKASYLRRRTFDFLQKTETVHEDKQYALDNDQTWQDLNLFCGKSDRNKYVGASIDRTGTEVGKCSLFSMLAKATTNIPKLQGRQEIIQTLIEKKELREQLKKSLTDLKTPEAILLSFWERDHFKNTLNRCYFSIPGFEEIKLETLNESDLALLSLSLTNHGARISDTVITGLTTLALTIYGVLQLANSDKSPEHVKSWAEQYRNRKSFIWRYLWDKENSQLRGVLALIGAVLCAGKTKESFDWASDCFLLEQCVHTFADHVATYLKATRQFYNVMQQIPTLTIFKELTPITTFFDEKIGASEKLQQLFDLLESETFEQKPSLFNSMTSHKGVFLLAYRLIGEVLQELQDMVRAVGKLDAYISLATLVEENRNTNTPYCFANYAQADAPLVDAQDFWHPLIDPENVVPNSITLGTPGNRANVILTGPNAGGKSSTLKALSIAVVMAQSVGIVPAQSFTLTPFSMISTYLNITDDIGAGNSLFKTEAIRTQQLVDGIEHLKPGHFSFTVFDEIFHGTSPVEGTAAAYSVAQHLAGYDQSMCLIATHFPLLTELEQHTKTFSNYHVSVEHVRGGQIYYPYKLERGISEQHVALDILRNQGIHGSVVDKAIEILEKSKK
ncbi:hypothetical protein K2W90_00690 [Candidatus Babeliales bacterium]|nr:hypothetical protein [Candidatus Babeliales bacterium]